MKLQIGIIGITLLLIVVSQSRCIEAQDDVFTDLEYSNTEYGFGINPPEGWTVQETGGGLGIIVMFLGPTEDNFNINMVISSDTLETGETLSILADEFIDLYEVNENFTLILSGETTVNDMNAYEIEYTMNILKQKMVMVEKNNKILILVYSALETSYDNYIAVFEESVNSLIISDVQSINILYPSNGETLYKGRTYNITWDSVNVWNNIGVSLINQTVANGFQAHHYIEQNISNSGLYKWEIPEDFPSGNYSLLIYTEDEQLPYNQVSDSVNITIETWTDTQELAPGESTPGFELIFVVFAIAFFLALRRKIN